MKELRRYIKSILNEEWATPPARKKNLRFNEDLMILWSPKSDGLYIMADAGYLEDYPHGSYWDIDKFSIYVMGMLQVTSKLEHHCHGARVVRRGAAVDGYGPTLYDAVMELTPYPIINDRESVESDVIDMMDFYLNNRNDVQKQLLDNVEDREYGPVTPKKPYLGRTQDPKDDCVPGNLDSFTAGVKKGSDRRWNDDPLSYAYNKELTPRVREMMDKGTKFMKEYGVEYWDLRKLGSDFFTSRFL